MSAFAEDGDRRLVPRWRFSADTASSAEFAGDPRVARPNTVDRHYLDQKIADWETVPSIGRAIEAVSCSLAGPWRDEAIDAAKFLQQRQDLLSPSATRLVLRAFHPQGHDPEQRDDALFLAASQPMTFDVARGKAAKAKHKVRVNPRNVLAWLDLSRAYTILGQQQRALAAIDCALALAPNHRHVLRAAARLFVHVGDSERAHALLAKHPKTRKDPWLLAAELAIANVAQRPPRHVRQGRALIDSDDLPPAHLTELHSAIGTLEYYHGAHRKARQSLRASLEAPTENVVAQARWMRKQLPGLPIAEEAFALPLGFEARTWRALEEGRWDDARVECRQWLNDEPFSSRPASLGSYIGVSLTTDYSFAEACARAGLQADPNDATLQNNLTVALAYQGKLDDAIEIFAGIPRPVDSDLPAYVYVATAGLLQFRFGDIEGGRVAYRRAAELAPRQSQHRVEIFWAREELNAATSEAASHLERALAHKPKEHDRDTVQLQALLRAQADVSRQTQDFDSHALAAPYEAAVLPQSGQLALSSSIDPTRRDIIMAGKKNSHTGYRSSVTGRFVKEGYAKRYPNRTQKESIPNPGRGDTGRGKKS